MPKKAETQIQKDCQQWLDRNGGFAMKTHGDAIQGSGWPDLIGGVWGNPLVIETKTPEYSLTKLQRVVLQDFEDQGYLTFVVTSGRDLEMQYSKRVRERHKGIRRVWR